MQPLPTYAQALEASLAIMKATAVVESVSLQEASNRILANDIVADRDFPPFHRSQMDGYAVLAQEVGEGISMEVIGQVSAGSTFDGEHETKTCVAIATGASVPHCFDAVVPHEQTDSGERQVVFNCESVHSGACIHPQGVDAKAGEVLVGTNTTLKPQHIAIAASVGIANVDVRSKPRVIIISSGDEVVPVDEIPLPHQIRNSNSALVCAAFESMGCTVVASHHVNDEEELTSRCIEESVDSRADLVVTIGGISAGKKDYFPIAFERTGVVLAVKGVQMQPGRPVIIGRNNHAMVLALPGNPVSTIACTCLFGWPIVRGLLGAPPELPWQNATLHEGVTPNPHRCAFRPCTFVDGNVSIPRWQGSGDLSHTSTTNGLVQLPASEYELQAGAKVKFLPYPWA